MAGLKCDGLIAVWVVDALRNRPISKVYAETKLSPALKAGDAVILDNVSSLKSEKAEKLVRDRAAWLRAFN